MLNTAYALPYAIAQPFLGPIGDRFGKARCIQVCVAGLALMLAAGAFATSFAFLLGTRIAAGIFAGGLIPLVLAGLGDTYDMTERQVMIGRMLFAIIAGQMLGSVVSGFANAAFGWHSSLFIAAAIGALAVLSPGRPCRRARRAARCRLGLVHGALRPRLRQPESALALRRGAGRGRRSSSACSPSWASCC